MNTNEEMFAVNIDIEANYPDAFLNVALLFCLIILC